MKSDEIIIRKTKRREITFEKSATLEDSFTITIWKDDWEDTTIMLHKLDVQKMMDFVNKKSKS